MYKYESVLDASACQKQSELTATSKVTLLVTSTTCNGHSMYKSKQIGCHAIRKKRTGNVKYRQVTCFFKDQYKKSLLYRILTRYK